MKKLLVISIMFLLVAASGAFAQDVQYNFDKQTNFAAFKTYKWIVLAGAKRPNDLIDKQIRQTVDAQLAAKGLSKATGENADLYIAYQMAVDKEKEFSSYTSGWGYGPGWGWGGWYGGGGGWTTGQTSTIYVGQLGLDVYDATHRELIWRGTVSKTIDTDAKPEKQQKNLTKAVAKLLENYPPQAK